MSAFRAAVISSLLLTACGTDPTEGCNKIAGLQVSAGLTPRRQLARSDAPVVGRLGRAANEQSSI
jgi:hypothetical protein